MSRTLVLFVLLIFLAACGPAIPTSPADTILTSASATPTTEAIPPTQTSVPVPTAFPTQSAAGLLIVTRQLTGVPDMDTLTFASVQGENFDYQSLQRHDPFDYQWGESSGMWAMLGEDKLVAAEGYSDDCQKSWATVTRNGEEIYRIDGGKCSPLPVLWGFFTYDGHWVLETNNYSDDDPALGRITLDGILVNDREGYQQAFNAQTIAGKLFYFFQKDGKYHAWYDGQEIPLGYDRISHYGCCSEGALNPQKWLDMVGFFAVQGDTWYFIQVGTADAFLP